jgi:HAE1 family hydrophobic/amphiphilic exporter-1
MTMTALAITAVAAVMLGMHLPTGFIPQKDQGYLFAALQLPAASSLQRTDSAALQVSKALTDTPGIGGVIAVNGFNLFSRTQSTNTAFFFVSLKPWDTRKSKEEQIEAIQANVQRELEV